MTAPPVRYGVVGRGWRADFYFRLARLAPGRFDCVGAVARTAAGRGSVAEQWGVPVYQNAADLVASQAPELVVTSVPREANPGVIESLVALGVPVLAETPPAADRPGLERLWQSVGSTGLVHVAEQHPYLPIFSALRILVRRGVLGEATSAYLSWTHDYHAIATLRCLLGVGGEPARVTAVRAEAPLAEGPGRAGWPASPGLRATRYTVATIEVSGHVGVYDFTDGQWFNPLRRRTVILRGSRGEVSGAGVVWSAADGRAVSAPITRQQAGLDGNLEGVGLTALTWAGEVLYRNPYGEARLSDEEIAIATCVERAARWHRGGSAAPYSLAEASQDQLLALAIHAAAADGVPVTTVAAPWAASIPAASPE